VYSTILACTNAHFRAAEIENLHYATGGVIGNGGVKWNIYHNSVQPLLVAFFTSLGPISFEDDSRFFF